MIAKDRFTLLDAYDASTEFKILTGKQVSLYVFNQPCAYQVLKPPSDGPRGFETQTEEQVSPGTIVFPGASGIRLRNVIAGGGSPQGLCSVRVYDRADVIGVGYVPITTTVLASGAIAATGVIDRIIADTDVVSTNAETTLYNFNFTANQIGATGIARLLIDGDFLYNNLNTDTLRLRVKLGATTILDWTYGTGGAVLSANRCGWSLYVKVQNRTTGSQTCVCQGGPAGRSTGGPTLGDITVNSAIKGGYTNSGAGLVNAYGTATEDTTAARSLTVTAQWLTSSANNSFRLRGGSLELL